MIRRILTEIPLVLPALFIAFVIWLIAKEGDLGQDSVRVPVTLVGMPPYMAVTSVPSEIEVKVRFPHDLANNIVPRQFSITINVADRFDEPTKWASPTTASEMEYPLSPRRDVRTLLPHTVTISDVIPNNLKLRATLRTRLADIHVTTINQLPKALEFIGPPTPDPDQALVTGSEDALRNLTEKQNNRIDTTSIDLSELRESGQVSRELKLPEGLLLLQPKDKRISIAIGLQEHSTSRTVEQVPIPISTFSQDLKVTITPETARIVLFGPPTALDKIGNDDFEFTLGGELSYDTGKKQDIGIAPHFKSRVPSEVTQKVRIVQCLPPRIKVEFTKDNGQNGAASTPTGRVQ